MSLLSPRQIGQAFSKTSQTGSKPPLVRQRKTLSIKTVDIREERQRLAEAEKQLRETEQIASEKEAVQKENERLSDNIEPVEPAELDRLKQLKKNYTKGPWKS